MMRVVSGSAGGIALQAVPGLKTRPTSDKVKEAMFSAIGPYFDGGMVLDLFAGTGGLGIEALSRGMERGIFIDRHQKAIRTIHHNLRLTNLSDQAEVYANDARRALKVLAKRHIEFELMLIDPPYHYNEKDFEQLLQDIAASRLLAKRATIVIEHHSEVPLAAAYSSITFQKQLQYGETMLSIYYNFEGDDE